MFPQNRYHISSLLWLIKAASHWNTSKLEQLERFHSEDTPVHLMITYAIDSYWIPSQKKTKSKLQI